MKQQKIFVSTRRRNCLYFGRFPSSFLHILQRVELVLHTPVETYSFLNPPSTQSNYFLYITNNCKWRLNILSTIYKIKHSAQIPLRRNRVNKNSGRVQDCPHKSIIFSYNIRQGELKSYQGRLVPHHWTNLIECH